MLFLFFFFHTFIKKKRSGASKLQLKRLNYEKSRKLPWIYLCFALNGEKFCSAKERTFFNWFASFKGGIKWLKKVSFIERIQKGFKFGKHYVIRIESRYLWALSFAIAKTMQHNITSVGVFSGNIFYTVIMEGGFDKSDLIYYYLPSQLYNRNFQINSL